MRLSAGLANGPQARIVEAMNDAPSHEPPALRFHNPAINTMGKPATTSLVELAGVGAALLFALVAPALVVPPGRANAPTGQVLLAVGLTVLGVLVALAIALLAYRRTRNFSWLIIGLVPSFALLAGGAIMAATKLGT